MSQITKINGVPIANTSVSAFTYNDANTFTISNTNGTSFSTSINSVTGLTFNGDAIFNNGNITNPDYIQFNTTVTGVTNTEGKMWWDEPNGTVSLGMHGGLVSQQIGLEYYYYVKNQSGTTIENGRVVRAAGTLGASGRILGEYMIADGSIPQKYTLGIATEDILNGDDGYVTEFGLVRGIDTTGSLYGETWVDGDILYVSPTIAGGLTKVEPSTPNLKIEVAIVIYANANGSIFVRPNRYPNIRDLNDVKISGVTNLDIIQYNSSLGYWVHTNTPTLSGLTATTISATTYQGLPTDVYITGGTYSSGTLYLTNNTGNTFSVSGFSTSTATAFTGGTVTGATIFTGGLSANTISATTYQNLPIISRELTFNSNDMALNTATRSTLTPLVMAVTRFDGTGAVDDAGLSFTIPSDYVGDAQFYFIWRAASTSSNTAKIYLDLYTGNTSNLGSLTTSVETLGILTTPTNTNTFIFSSAATSTLSLVSGNTVHLRIYRDPGDASDTYTGALDMINFNFKYNSIS